MNGKRVLVVDDNIIDARALSNKLRSEGYEVLLAHTLNKPEREEACIRRFLSRRVDGIFLCPVYRMGTESRIYQELAARRVPTVLLGHTNWSARLASPILKSPKKQISKQVKCTTSYRNEIKP